MIYSKKKIIRIGNIVRTHGVQGALLVRLFPGYNASLLSSAEWCFITIRDKPVPFKILAYTESGESELILELEKLKSKPQAEEFLNYEIAIERNNPIRKKKTENINLMLGYTIFNSGKSIGIIENIENTGKQFLFVLNDEKMIPAHEDLIEKIDDKKKIVFMNLPEGLV